MTAADGARVVLVRLRGVLEHRANDEVELAFAAAEELERDLEALLCHFEGSARDRTRLA